MKKDIDINSLNIVNKPPMEETTAQEVKQVNIPHPTMEPPAETVELPSKGLLYQDVTDDPDILEGKIKIRPMTLTEEKILSTNRLIKTGQALDMVFRNCIKSKIDPLDLLSSDRLFLMFYLRGISYGNEYTFTLKCPNPACGRQFRYTVDISKQEVKELPDDIEEPIRVELPKTKAVVYYHLPRGRDEIAMRKMQEQLVNANDVDNSTTNRFLRLIDKIETPDGDEISRKDMKAFLNSLIAYDVAYLREHMNEHDGGIEPIKDVICPYCDEEFEVDIPVTIDFFRVKV